MKVAIPDYSDSYGFAYQVGGNGLVFINTAPMKGSPHGDPIDTIIHESVHIWQGVCEYMLEEKSGDEVEAYGIAFIASTLIKEYQRQIAQKEADAIHDQREARLQEGKPSVQLETGTD